MRDPGDKHDVLYCPNFENEDESNNCRVMPMIRQGIREERKHMSDRWNALYDMVPRSAEAALAADVERLRTAIGYATARLEDDEIDQALNTLKVVRGDNVRDHYPDDNSRTAVKQLQDAVKRLAAPIDYADALLRYIEQLERRALS